MSEILLNNSSSLLDWILLSTPPPIWLHRALSYKRKEKINKMINAVNTRGITINHTNKRFHWEPWRAPCVDDSESFRSVRPVRQTLASARATARQSSWTAAVVKSYFGLITIHDEMGWGGGGIKNTFTWQVQRRSRHGVSRRKLTSKRVTPGESQRKRKDKDW